MVNKGDSVDGNITAKHKLLFYIVHPMAFIKEFKSNRSKLLFMRSIAACPFYMAMTNFLKHIEKNSSKGYRKLV